MQRCDFHYDLPPGLIAQFPARNRTDSRLLHLPAPPEVAHDRRFADLPELLRPNDLLVFNDTRVMRARLYGRKETGGRVELLIERVLEPGRGLAHIKASKPPRSGCRIRLEGGAEIRVQGREDELFIVETPGDDLPSLMATSGHIPLPPYITRQDGTLDEERYQTVYSRCEGAVAAPTAGLHFDSKMLQRLDEIGIERAHITLHVGAGTFRPVRADRLEDHVMHSEQAEVSVSVCEQVRAARARGGRVVAVGTTSVRSLESASGSGEIMPFQGDTRLFITPGYRFRSVDALITNFHLPESTLLMLVAAFSGHARIMQAYRHAVEQGYRFFSYGDAMFLERNGET